MDICRFTGDSENGKLSGNIKNATSPKDIKKKLSCINRRINDLHRQKKLLYKNSIKVKKVVHNQINQIVKCLRARERSICSDVDDVFFSEDASIGDELSKLQSVYAHCQALLNHVEDFKEKCDILRKIDSILSEIHVDEKSDVKALEFMSDFEMMKIKASSYGYLDGDFIKKDDFVYIDEQKDNKMPDDNCKAKELLIKNSSFKNEVITPGKMNSLYRTTDSDDFQIIDLLDNMNCQDTDEDFVMDEDVTCNTLHNENDLSQPISEKSANTFRIKEYNTLKSTPENAEVNIDFNPEEEWKQILEMNRKLENWQEMIPKKSVSNHQEREKTQVKNCHSKKLNILKEESSWLHHSTHSETQDTPRKMCEEMNSTSPAEIIKQSFKCYATKDNIQHWLSAH